MKKIAAILLSAILACSFMVGCGDDEDSSSKKSKKDSSVSAADESGEDESKEDESKGDDTSKEDEGSKDDDSSKEDESSKSGTNEFYVDNNLVGKWQATQVTDGEWTYTKDFDGIEIKTVRFEFNADNTGYYYHPSHNTEIKWSMKDGVGFALNEDVNDKLPLKLDGAELVATEGDIVFRFKKVDQFDVAPVEPDTSKPDKPDDSSKTEPNTELDTSYVGTWKCSRMVVGTTEIKGDQDLGNGLLLADSFTMELKADGTGVMISKVSSSGEDREEFRWKSINGGIWLDDDYDEYEFPFDGNEIEFDTGDGIIYLKKAK